MIGPGAAPLIVRIAGLPAEAIAPFSHSVLIETLAERERLGERLGVMRTALVDCLHGAIRTSTKEERRFLLFVKRSCFNGSHLKPLQQDSRWPILVGVASTLADAIVTLEGAAEEVETRFEDLYRLALRRERECLVQLLDDRAFLRGIALASPDLAQNLDRLKSREPDDFGRREKRLCLTLLRYASRAALKLSPFSTLTRTGLALATDDPSRDFLFLPGDKWRERSTISLRRELLEQCSYLLLRCGRFAEGLEVALNETLTIDSDGRCSLFHPGHWEFDDESSTFHYREASSVKARLEGPLVPWLFAELRESPLTYRSLLDRARATLVGEDGELVSQGIAELIKIGFLTFILPFDFSGPDLERQILDYLQILPDDTGIEAFRDRLCELVKFLGGYSVAPPPLVRFLETSRHGVEGLFQALAPSASLDSRVEFKAYVKTFEEDVFLLPESESDHIGAHGIVHLSRERMNGLLEDLDPLARLFNLHSSGHDLLHTLAVFGERRWPGVKEVSLLDFFDAAQSLFIEYLRYRAGLLAHPVTLPPGFNPLELESLKRLIHWREQVERGLSTCFHETDEAQRLCPRDLGTLLDEVPGHYARSCAFCAFVQPLDPGGRMWALNAIREGFGRFGSRFTSGMDENTRAYWSSYFSRLSLFDLDGEQVEVVDVACQGHRTINVHAPQTLRVLKMPGEHSAVGPDRLLRLNDLRVRLGGAEREPMLTDASGQRLLLVPLGGMAEGGRPTLLKFLAIFGPGEFRRPLPMRVPRLADGLRVLDRQLLGEIVYARKRWMLKPQSLYSMVDAHGEMASYEAVNCWRLSKGIPDRVFVKEPITVLGSRYRQKPQYIDFSSPTFVQILKSILRTDFPTLVLEEALPAADQLPIREGRWAVEVQLESFGASLPSRGVREGSSMACPAGQTKGVADYEEKSPD